MNTPGRELGSSLEYALFADFELAPENVLPCHWCKLTGWWRSGEEEEVPFGDWLPLLLDIELFVDGI